MTSTPRHPLDAEERELAERLAQLGASAEPSSALDARILGAARAAARMGGEATTTPARTGRARPRRRWPVAMGVAATLVLAVGIAWQMRPVGETRQAYSEAPTAVQVVDAPAERPPLRRLPATEVDAALPPPAPQMRATAPPPAPAEAAGERAEAAATADEDAGAEAAFDSNARTSERRQRDGTSVEAPAEPEPRLLQDAANEAEEVSTAAPSAFPATTGTGASERKALRRETQKPAPEIVLDSAPVQSAPPPPPAPLAPQRREPARTAAPASVAPREALDRIEVTGTRIDRDNDGFSDQVIDDQPPATADSPLVQQAWLQRIRELIARDRIDAARTSLGEFKRRYPRYALPDDLRAFQQGTPAQSADAAHGEGHDAAEDGANGDDTDAGDADDTESDGGGASDGDQDPTGEGGFEQ